MTKPSIILCLKWGNKYGPEYVNRLLGMLKRQTSRPFRLVCITDDPAGISKEVDIKPMPPFNLPENFRWHPFRRMFIFREKLYDLEGDVLHLDLDLVVTGRIDDFFDYEPDCTFCVAENWTQINQGIGNMSVFRFRIGAHPYIYDQFIADPQKQRDLNRNSQTYVSRNIREMKYFPSDWCLSFKHSILPRWPLNLFMTPKLPPTAKIVAFTGKPDIHDAIEGNWPTSKWKKFYKYVKPTPWLADCWRE
jgi:hypothetical protein